MNLVSNTLNILNNQINTFVSNPAIPLTEKNRVSSMRQELDNIAREYQSRIESINKEFDTKLKSKGDEVQRSIEEITRRLT